MKRKIPALVLVLSLCVGGLTACGGGTVSPLPSGGLVAAGTAVTPAPGPTAAPAEPTAAPEPVLPGGEETVDLWGGSGSLEDFRCMAAGQHPNALAGIACVGVLRGPVEFPTLWDRLETDGYFPFVRDIPQERCVGEFKTTGTLWCVAPGGPRSIVTVCRHSAQGVGEPILTGKPGEPVLLLTDREKLEPGLMVVVKGFDNEKTELLPVPDLGRMEYLPSLPGDGTAFDFTVRAGRGTACTWQLCGDWDMKDCNQFFPGDRAPAGLLTTLSLRPDGGAACLFRREDGSLLSRYEGTWGRNGDGTLDLSLVFSQGEPVRQNGEEKRKLGGSYPVALGFSDTLLLECGPESSPLSSRHMEEGRELAQPVTFHRSGYAPRYHHENGDAMVRRAKEAAYGYRTLERGDVDSILLRRIEPEGLVFQLTDTVLGHAHGRAWYLVDPLTLEGRDYVTGESINFGPCAEDEAQLRAGEALIAYCRSRRDPTDPIQADFACVVDQDPQGLVFEVRGSGAEAQRTLATCVIDPETLLGFDEAGGELVDFGAYLS